MKVNSKFTLYEWVLREKIYGNEETNKYSTKTTQINRSNQGVIKVAHTHDNISFNTKSKSNILYTLMPLNARRRIW